MPRSWIARPVESKSVISSASLRPGGRAGEDGAEVGDVVAADLAARDRPGELAAGRGLLPLVAEEPAAGDRRRRHLGLAVAVGPEHARGAGRARGRRRRRPGSSPGVTVTTTSQASASARGPASQPSSAASASAASGASVGADARAVAGGGEAAGRPGAVDAAADDADASRASVAGQRLRRDRGRGAGPQRGDRGAVEDREQLAGLVAGDAAARRRRPAGRAPGCRGRR